MFYPYSWNNVSLKQFIDILDDTIQWYASKRINLSLDALSPLEYKCKLGLVASSNKTSAPPIYNILQFR